MESNLNLTFLAFDLNVKSVFFQNMPFWNDPIWTNRSNGNAELPHNDLLSANLLLFRQNRSQAKFLLHLQLNIKMPEVDRYDSVTPGYDSVTIYAL